MICKLDNMEDYSTYFVRSFSNFVDITKSYWQKISYYRQLPSCLLFRPQQKFAVFVNFFNPWEGFKKCLQKTNSNTYSTCTITYKTEHVDSILLCICSVVIDHRWCKNVVRTRKWLTSPAKCVTDVCILWPAIDYTNYTKWRCCRPQKWVHSLFLSELEPHPVLIGILKWMHLRLFLSSVFSDWEIKRAK